MVFKYRFYFNLIYIENFQKTTPQNGNCQLGVATNHSLFNRTREISRFVNKNNFVRENIKTEELDIPQNSYLHSETTLDQTSTLLRARKVSFSNY